MIMVVKDLFYFEINLPPGNPPGGGPPIPLGGNGGPPGPGGKGGRASHKCYEPKQIS